MPVTALPAPDNQAPVAGTPGTQTVDPTDGSVTATLGFTDPDGDTLDLRGHRRPANGAVTFTGDTYTYTPTTRPPFGQPDGTDAFTVTATDPGGLTATNTIQVPVTALPAPDNQAPVAGTPGTQTVDPADGSVTATLGFTDPDGDTLDYAVTDGPANGAVTFTGDTYTYTPTTRPPFGQPDGTDAFTVTATDPGGLTATNTIQVPVTALPAPDNQAPVAGTPGTQTVVPADGSVTATLGFTDPDGDTLDYAVTDGPANGAVTFTGDTYTYTPTTRPPFGQPDGTDAFTVTATDPGGLTATNTIQVPVTALPAGQTPTLQGIAQISGDPAEAPVVGPDGTVYQVVELGANSSANSTSIYTVNSDGSVNPQPLVDRAPGQPQGDMVFGQDGFAYQSVYRYDTQTALLLVIDTANPGTYATVEMDGAPDGDSFVVVGPDGSAYQLTKSYFGSSPTITRLTIVDPTNPGAATTLEFVGTNAQGSVAFGQNGTPYLADQNFDTDAESVAIVAIDVTSPTDPLTVIADSPGFIIGPGLVSGPDGAIYLTTHTSDSASGAITTHVVALDPQNPGTSVRFDLEGLPQDGVVVGPDGTAYQATTVTSIDGSDLTTLTETTRIVTIDPQNPSNPVVFETPGAVLGPLPSDLVVGGLSVGSDGTIFVITQITDYSDFPNSLPTSYQVAVIDPQTAGAFTVDLDSAPSGIAIGQDGRAYVTQLTEPEGNGVSEFITHLVVIDPAAASGTIRVADDIAGGPPSRGVPVAVDRNGIVYVTTETYDNGYDTHVTVIDPDAGANPILATYDIDGPAVGGPIVGLDDTVYQSTIGGGVDTELTNVGVIGTGSVAQSM